MSRGDDQRVAFGVARSSDRSGLAAAISAAVVLVGGSAEDALALGARRSVATLVAAALLASMLTVVHFSRRPTARRALHPID